MISRALICCAMFALSTVAIAGDVTISADGFIPGHRGNGTFTLKQQKNADGKPVECWAENHPSGVEWVASYNDMTGTRVVFSRNGVIICEYLVAAKNGTATLRYAVPQAQVPQSVKVN